MQLLELPDRALLQVVAQRLLLGVAQALLQRAEQCQRGDGERGHRGHQHGADDPAAETERWPPRTPACAAAGLDHGQ